MANAILNFHFDFLHPSLTSSFNLFSALASFPGYQNESFHIIIFYVFFSSSFLINLDNSFLCQWRNCCIITKVMMQYRMQIWPISVYFLFRTSGKESHSQAGSTNANEGNSYLRTSPSALLTPSQPPPSPWLPSDLDLGWYLLRSWTYLVKEGQTELLIVIV